MSSSECLARDPIPGREREMAWAALHPGPGHLPGAAAARVYAARALLDDAYLLAGPGAAARQASSQDQAATLTAWSGALAALGHLIESVLYGLASLLKVELEWTVTVFSLTG